MRNAIDRIARQNQNRPSYISAAEFQGGLWGKILAQQAGEKMERKFDAECLP
jgi:hypothetical protein